MLLQHKNINRSDKTYGIQISITRINKNYNEYGLGKDKTKNRQIFVQTIKTANSIRIYSTTGHAALPITSTLG